MIPLPYRDENPRSRVPVVTISIVLINIVVWFFELYQGVPLATLRYGAIPAWVLSGTHRGLLELTEHKAVMFTQGAPQPWTVLSSMFFHGSWAHIIGNLWFLWIFGDNVEEAMGRVRYAIFYLLCGVIAALAQILSVPHSTIPMVGASGAIAGVLGAYFVLYPRARVRCLWILVIFITTIVLPAWLLLGLWFLSQFLIPTHSGIAWMAHVGGFVAGVALVWLFILGRPRRRPSSPSYTVYVSR